MCMRAYVWYVPYVRVCMYGMYVRKYVCMFSCIHVGYVM